MPTTSLVQPTPEPCAWCEEAATVAFHNGWDDADLALCSSCVAEVVPQDVLDERPPTAAELAGRWPQFDAADELAAFELGEVA
jgi:hypothetical protein